MYAGTIPSVLQFTPWRALVADLLASGFLFTTLMHFTMSLPRFKEFWLLSVNS